MGTYTRIRPRWQWLLLMLFIITLFSPLVDVLPSNKSAQGLVTLHNQTLYELVEQTSGSDETSAIDVGASPIAIDINRFVVGGKETTQVYVANADSQSVSIITPMPNNRSTVETIPVGYVPMDIAVNDINDLAYVANSGSSGSNSVSVIYTLPNNTKRVETIHTPGETLPKAIALGSDPITYEEILYVANSGSDSVSVIIPMTNNRSIIETIPVGDSPIDIAVGSNDPYAQGDIIYVANSVSQSVSIITTMPDNTKRVEEVRVGSNPNAIAVDRFTDKVYVTNSYSDTVSIITTMPDNTKRVEEVRVGDKPDDMVLGENGTAYVANSGSNSVSVIYTLPNNTKTVETIPVGISPEDIAVGHDANTNNEILYVANSGSNSVSVITPMPNNRSTVEAIPVGSSPNAIAVDSDFGTVYVANRGSNSLSVIDDTTHKVVAGITFQVNPFNSGRIVCNDRTTPSPDDLTPPSPIGQHVYVYSGTECIAQPNSGFEFSSWEENNLEDNSTRPISFSRPASSLDSFLEFLHLKSPDKPEATLNITKFGTFTANFREAPPPLPQEFWVQMSAIIGTVVTALFIPSIVGWFRSKRDIRNLNYYHKQIASLYDDGKLDESDMEALDRLRSRIVNAHSEGKLSEKHYESLRVEISTLYEEIFRKKISALNSSNGPPDKKTTEEQLAKIRNEVEYAYSKEKITQKHYDLLNKAISDPNGKGADIS